MSFQPTTTCEILRPFGGSTQAEDVRCQLRAIRETDKLPIHLQDAKPTHILAVGPDVDVQDNATRGLGSTSITLTDGDEIRVPSGGTTSYVAIFVDRVARGTAFEHKVVYLIRHTVDWSDPETAP